MELYKNREWLHNEAILKRRTNPSIAKECGVTHAVINAWKGKFKLWNLRTKEKYAVNETKFSVSDPIFCYFAGLVATDGYISTRADLNTSRVCLRLKDDADTSRLLEALNAYFESTAPLFYYSKPTINTVELRITSNTLVEELRKVGIPGKNKTFDLEFPVNLSFICLNMYLRGTLDGDGCLGKTSNTRLRYRICTASSSFIENYKNYLENKYNAHICSTLNAGKYPNIEWNNKKVLLFLKDIYADYPEFRLNRKYNIYNDIVRTLEKSKELCDKERKG